MKIDFKLKLFILFILSIIYIFFINIISVKAYYTYELYELDKVNLSYLTYIGDTPINSTTDFNSLDFDKYTYYDTFYGHIKENVGTTEPYTGIRGYINQVLTPLTYFSFIVYSPTQLNNSNWTVCMYGNSTYCSSDINNNTINSPQITEIKLNTTSDNYFYIIGWYGLADSYDGYLDSYRFSWYDSSNLNSLVTSTPNVYAISNLFSFSTQSQRDEFIQSTYDYLSTVTEEDPELPDNPILGAFTPNVDTDDWTVVIGGWNTDFNPSTNNPISNLAQLPIIFLTSVNNAISGTCTPVNYIELYNYQVVLPCLNLSTRLGVVWTIIDTIFSCMLIYSIGKSLVLTFARLSDMDTNIMYECYSEGIQKRGRD